MAIKFVTDFPAVFIPEKKMLVIAELHIGLEYDLYKSGIRIPKQIKKFEEVIDYLLEITKASTIVILGDIKHKVPGISIQELKDIPIFLEFLQSKVKKIVLVKGNHDTDLEDSIPKGVKIYSSRGFKIGKYGFFHGHAWPSKNLMQCDYLFMGHIHPAIEFRDEFGHRNSEKVWVKGKLDEKKVKEKFKLGNTGKLNTIFIPTFNNILGGTAVNRLSKNEQISPIIVNKFIDLDSSKIYLLDGTYLGILKNIKKINFRNLQANEV